jgi:transcription elongation factor GreA
LLVERNLSFKELGQVRIEKIGQLFRNNLESMVFEAENGFLVGSGKIKALGRDWRKKSGHAPSCGVMGRRERVMSMDKFPMTAGGYSALEEELKRRQQVERPRIIQAIAEARTHGDIAENAEYHAAKDAQALNEGRIAELEDKLSRAEVIDVSKLSGNTIKFGATVTLVDEDTDEKKTYQIVGESEADVKAGRVSITSPTARALIGKKTGDSVEVNTPGGGKSYEILNVAFQ